MGVGAGLYMYVVVVQKFTFAISSPDEFLLYNETLQQTFRPSLSKSSKYDSDRHFDPHFEEVRGRRRTLVDGSLESPCRVLVNCN